MFALSTRSLRSFPSSVTPFSSIFSTTTTTPSSTSSKRFLQSHSQPDLQYAIQMVRKHDPAGYLPGKLLPTETLQTAYFAVRCFWVETGLRIHSTAKVQDLKRATPTELLDWWQQSVDSLYKNDATTTDHPTIRLLQSALPQSTSTTQHLTDVLQGRRNDLDLKQYPTLQHLEDHAALSCASLFQLVLESGNMTPQTNPTAHQAARLVGIGHGLTNALRTSIPVISTTGKLIVPHDLCQKHRVQSPRYLLSALGQGDDAAKEALNSAVRDIAQRAQDHLDDARDLREEVLKEDQGHHAVSVLLPGLASETFLQRLAQSGHDLTDRDLRNVGMLEHGQCAVRMVSAYYQSTY